MKRLMHRIAGRKFKPLKSRTRWQDNPQFTGYFARKMSPEHETGVHGAIRASLNGRKLERGISVGSGTGDNERALVKAGFVENFDLFEVSKDRIAQSEALAADAGIADRFQHHLDDALTHDIHEQYDLVFWSHSLHHMFDVDRAVAWSIKALKPKGLLVIDEYIGPTRLQWRRKEVNLVRQFLRDHHETLGVEPSRVRHSSPFRRFKQFLRDPSEAPQSDLIQAAYRRHTGTDMTVLGGAVIHLGGGFLTGAEDQDPTIHDQLIALDQEAEKQGLAHFAFGLWEKP